MLHHLPDYWKHVALTRVCGMLKPKGRFLLFDIVLPSVINNIQYEIDEWINAVKAMADERLAQ
ncbi:MAG: hypothetical protein ACE14P_09120 [Methanotrichaceae archaeon]